jgi:glycosyltransferase involved in cell wall biosynthesis
MIEAMACGTPILAFRCGSVPEIIENGLTGAIVDSMEAAIAALPAGHRARPKKGAPTVRATLFRHTDGEGLCPRLS